MSQIIKDQFARKKDKKREDKRKALALKIKHPVIKRVTKDTNEKKNILLISAALGIALHLIFFLTANYLKADDFEKKKQDKTEIVNFVFTSQKNIEEPEEIAIEEEPEQEVEPEEVIEVKEVTPKPKQRPEVEPEPKSSPDQNQQPERRRIVGLDYSSTAQSDGPSFAVGNTRMGQTDTQIADEPIKNSARPKNNSQGSGEGTRLSKEDIQERLMANTPELVRPKRVRKIELEYPPELKKRGIEGNVLVLIIINEQGRVDDVNILRSSGHMEFDEAATNAAREELFEPARLEGKPVGYNLQYTYRFRIRGA